MSETTVEARGQHVAPAEEEPQQPKKRKRFRAWQKVLLAIAIVLVVLLAAGAISVAVLYNTGKDELLQSNESTYAFKKIKYNDTVYEFNQNMVSIVLIGNDRLGNAIEGTIGQSDAVMVMAYDTENGDLTLINVPRNLYFRTNITFDDGLKREQNVMLSAVYGFRGSDEAASEEVCSVVSQLFGNIPLKNYATLSMLSVGPLADAMGGVTLTATDNVPIEGIVKGETYTLKSWKALRYVQYRDPTIMTSPADRMVRQHDFAKAFVKQTIEAAKKDPMVLKRIYDVITNPDYMITTLDFPEVAYLALSMVQNGAPELNLVTVPYTVEYSELLESTKYLPDEDALKQMLIDIYYHPAETE